MGDELAQEFPDLIDEAPPPAGKVGEQDAKELDADVREPGPDVTKKPPVARRVGSMDSSWLGA